MEISQWHAALANRSRLSSLRQVSFQCGMAIYAAHLCGVYACCVREHSKVYRCLKLSTLRSNVDPVLFCIKTGSILEPTKFAPFLYITEKARLGLEAGKSNIHHSILAMAGWCKESNRSSEQCCGKISFPQSRATLTVAKTSRSNITEVRCLWRWAPPCWWHGFNYKFEYVETCKERTQDRGHMAWLGPCKVLWITLLSPLLYQANTNEVENQDQSVQVVPWATEYRSWKGNSREKEWRPHKWRYSTPDFEDPVLSQCTVAVMGRGEQEHDGEPGEVEEDYLTDESCGCFT